MDLCTRFSVAVNRSTFPTNSCMRFPAFLTTSSSAQVAPGSTGGTLSSMSGGSQLEGSGNAMAISVAAEGFALAMAASSLGDISTTGDCKLLSCSCAVASPGCSFKYSCRTCIARCSFPPSAKARASRGWILAACPCPRSAARSASWIAPSK